MMPKPEDTFEMEISATTTKAALTNNTVPDNKFARKVYGMVLNNEAAAVAGITFTLEEDTTVQRTLPEIILAANGTVDLVRPLESPIITIRAGWNIKAQVTTGTGPINCIFQAYDL